MARHADAFHDDSFDAEDSFLDDPAVTSASDPFLDASAVERRMLGEPEPALTHAELTAGGLRPFGARLAEANFAPEPQPARARSDVRPAPPRPAPAAAAPRPVVAMNPADGGLYGEVGGDEDDVLINQPVPRIAIQAFCERPETGQLIHHAGADRRLSRAHLTVELGGLAAAIERFHDAQTPELLIIETGMRERELFAQLEELAGICDADTKVVIIGAANDISLYRELIRRGVSEYLVPPMTPLHLIKTISGLFLDPDAPFAGRTLAFVGAKGGVGSSTVAHNVAWHITESLRTDAVLVDLDLSFGTAGLDFNQDPAQTIAEALAQPERLDDALLDRLLVKCTERLSLFSAPATLESDWDFDADSFDMVLEKVRRQAPYIALDVPHAWSPSVRRTILSADQVIVTVTPDLACLRNAKNLFDLVRQARPNDEPPKVVVNMAGCPKKPDIPLKDFADALGAAPLLVLPFDPALFGKAANNGQMIGEVDPKSRPAEGFAHLASVLAGRAAPPARRKSLFGSLFSKG